METPFITAHFIIRHIQILFWLPHKTGVLLA